MAADSTSLINRLLQAEEEAAKIIENAKTSKTTKLKQAKANAVQQLETFKRDEESKYNEELAKLKANDPSAKLESSSAKELAMVQQDYESNKDATVKYIVEKVKQVNLELTDTQKLALKNNQV